MKNLKLLIFILFLFSATANAEIVKYVYDGDTFTTTDGKKVRLLNINTPETAKKNSKSEPYSVKAKDLLNELINKKEVILKFDEEQKDKYNRYLAYVYLKDGTFVNKEMLKSGFAHLYSFPKNTSKYDELKPAENNAREQNLGIWSHNRWKIQNANSKEQIADFRFGKYQMFDGKIKEVTAVKDKLFLNFGDNWRTDFSVEIKKRDFKYFTKANIDPTKYYEDKKVRVRGILIPVNGGLINVTHPQQLEVIE